MTLARNLKDQYLHASTIKDHRGYHRMIFAYLSPDGLLQSVIDAKTYQDAWVIASGWEDRAGIAQRAAQGWQIIPAFVVWSRNLDKRATDEIVDGDVPVCAL